MTFLKVRRTTIIASDSGYINTAILQRANKDFAASTKIQTLKLTPSGASMGCAFGEADTRMRGVVNGVIVLKELLTDEEVDTGRATIVDPGIVES